MECCSKCFKKLCRCGQPRVEIDYYIYPAIYELNRKGYWTNSCCSGHSDSEHLSTYISFYDEIETDIESEFIQFESYNYRGFHERRNCIRLKPELTKKFTKKRTNKLALIQEINKDLYRWAKSLPYRTSLDDLEDIGSNFAETYFDEEIITDEVIDVQNPWILFTKVADGCKYTISDFFNEIEPVDSLSELIVNRSGHIRRFRDQDYAFPLLHTEHSSNLKDKIVFDISGDYKYLLCGYEPYIMIEKIRTGDAVWYLSYARTDIAIEYGDGDGGSYTAALVDEDDIDEHAEKHSNKIASNGKTLDYTDTLFDEEDIADFWDEHSGATELDLFTYLFNRMCRAHINICVFSAENVNIIFSNKTDFSLLMTKDQAVVAFGKADYEYMDFSQIHVEQKEVFAYTNGRLLMRKEVE